MAKKDPNDKPAAAQAREVTKAGRVVCNLTGLPAEVDGVKFATVRMDDGASFHVSERIPAEKVNRFINHGTGDYAVCALDEETHSERIDDAIEAAHHPAPSPEAAAVDLAALNGLRQDLEDTRRNNLALSADLRAERARGDQLASEVEALKKENAELKAAGMRVTAIGSEGAAAAAGVTAAKGQD